MHSNGGPLDNYETTFWHSIYTIKRWKHRTYDPVWDYGQVQCNNTNDTRNEVTSSDILELVACEDFNENISEEVEENANENNTETLLMCILQKLRNQKGKVDWSQVTTTDLYVEKLATAKSIAENFFTKELDIISSVVSQYTKKKSVFNKSANKYTKVNTLSTLFGDSSVWFPTVLHKKL